MIRAVNILLLIMMCEHIYAQSEVEIVEKESAQLKTGKMIGPEDPYYFGGFISPVKPFEHLEHSLTDRLRLSPYIHPNTRNYREGPTDAAGLLVAAAENSLVSCQFNIVG